MKQNKLVLGYVPGGTGSVYPFGCTFTGGGQDVTRHGFDGVDALAVWGGVDICPSYYNEEPHPANDKQNGPCERDRREWAAMKYAKINGIPIIGICRGAQMLCAFSGGSLVQHVTGHHGDHYVTFVDESLPQMLTSSCHHQMMYPWKTDYQLLAYSSRNLSTIYGGAKGNPVKDMHGKVEPEVVYFPRTRGLAIQGHPEWMDQTSPFVEWCNRQVVELLLTEKEVA